MTQTGTTLEPVSGQILDRPITYPFSSNELSRANYLIGYGISSSLLSIT